ncbi:hypothetical protein [Ruficoccus sp. ZRK36]|uniref:hypothetical protein n=1 Tax=Ruficoccus sp. ZRK36 TaxID=2866311 RepID=UPI001C737CDF|nr:hypothetical protein [Ruficoccus sp. ZRK36]QYY35248.1 hypothetical protein K0V07_13210 [Ruficoccus sp. ZRK36]
MSKIQTLIVLASSLTVTAATVTEAKVVFSDASEYYQSFEEEAYGVSSETDINTSGTYPWTDNATIVGWYAVVDGKSASKYGATNGNNRKGDEGIYLFRKNGKNGALGTLRKSSTTGLTAIGLEIGNDTGASMTGFSIKYKGQQWQQNSGGADQLTLQYSTDATSLTTGSWTTVDDLTFKSIKDSGSEDYAGLSLSGSVQSEDVSGKITGLNVKDGQSIWIRWVDEDNKGVDQALSIDSLKIKPTLSK